MYFILVAVIIDINNFLHVGKIIIILAPVIILSFTAVFISLNNRLKKAISFLQGIEKNPDKERLVNFINRYPFRAALPLVAGCALGPLLTGIIGLYIKVFYSVAQAFFVILIGEILALIVGLILYYYAKQYLYPSNRIIEYRPLSIFHRLSIPSVSSVLLIITLFCI